MKTICTSACKRFLLLLLAMVLLCACSNQINGQNNNEMVEPDVPGEDDTGADPEDGSIVHEKALWGEWVRIDRDEVWLINSYSVKVGDELKSNVELELLSDGIIKVQEDGQVFCLYASRRANARITGRMRNMDSIETRGIFGGWLDNIIGSIENVNDRNDKSEFQTDSEGNFEVDGLIAGNDYEISIEGQEPVLITPSWNGEDIGVISFCDGINFKVAAERVEDEVYYANGLYDYTCNLKITNLGDEDCLAACFFIAPEPGLHCEVIGEYADHPILGTIEAGKSKTVQLKLRSDAIEDESIFRKLDITIRDDINNKEWSDSVSFKFYQRPLAFNIYSTDSISGVLQCGDYTQSFHASEDINIVFPYIDTEYSLVFSGATAETEAIYSIGIDVPAHRNIGSFQDPGIFEPNDTGDEACNLAYFSPVTAYLHKNDIDYYKFTTNGVSPTYAVGYEGPAGGLIVYDKGNDEGGWRFIEASLNPVKVVDDVLTIDPEVEGYDTGISRFTWGRDFHCFDWFNQSEIGAGADNTFYILASNSYNPGKEKYYAAEVCADLVSFNDGRMFDDWFLPSSQEARLLNDMVEEEFWTSVDGYYGYDQYYGYTSKLERKRKDSLFPCYPMRFVSSGSVPAPHVFQQNGKVTMTCDMPDAEIHYSSSTSRTSSDWHEYVNPLDAFDNAIKVYASREGMNDSCMVVELVTRKQQFANKQDGSV